MYINIACIGIHSIHVFFIEFPLIDAFTHAIYSRAHRLFGHPHVFILTIKIYMK